jgi:hypothetical protein
VVATQQILQCPWIGYFDGHFALLSTVPGIGDLYVEGKL